MTDRELRDAAVEALKATTIAYPKWESRVEAGYYPHPENTGWGKAFDLLDQIGGTPEPEPKPPPTGVKNNLLVTRLGTGTVGTGGDLTRYGYVALNPWEHAKAKQLKDAGVVTLAYKCMSSSRDAPSQGDDTAGGVRYSTANPEWFLTKDGQRIEWAGFPHHFQMDIGFAAYQAAWVKQVLANLAAHPGSWSGVIVDNANMAPGSAYFSFPTDLYASAGSYAAATREFLSVVAPQITAAGHLFIPNIQHHGSSAVLTEALWRDWVQFCSGGHLEHYTKWGGDPANWITGSGWESSCQVFARATQQMGKTFLGTFSSPISDAKSQSYARASFLMEWNGGPSALGYEPNPLAQDPWSPVWTKDVGLPLEPKVWNGVRWTRRYERGSVSVNPNTAEGVVA